MAIPPTDPDTIQEASAGFGLRAQETSFPLHKMAIQGEVTGLLYRLKVSQTFVNDRDQPLEAVYIHPLPPRAAVHGFALQIGERRLEGQIKERAKARADYQEGLQEGKRVALLEEERSDIFTTSVGNIGPGEEVEISFEISGYLDCFEREARLRFPLVVPEIYIAGTPLSRSSVGDGVYCDTDAVPDASRITPPRLPRGGPNPVELSIDIGVDSAGLQVESISSSCQAAQLSLEGLNYRARLEPGGQRLDRDFHLRLQLADHPGGSPAQSNSSPHGGSAGRAADGLTGAQRGGGAGSVRFDEGMVHGSRSAGSPSHRRQPHAPGPFPVARLRPPD